MKARKLVPLFLVIAGLLAYQNSFTAPFVFDDKSSILENNSIRHLWPIWSALSPPSMAGVGGRPVVNLSLAVNYALGGYNVWGYHALNLAVHILGGLTLLGVVRRTLLQPALRERFGAAATELALAVAVLWTVHPLQTEAVTYISERCELLMGLFYLLTVYCFIRGTNAQRSSWWFALSVVACFLGMASKEVMVTAPVMVLLYDRTFVSGSFRQAWTRHRRLYLGLASTWVLLGYLMVGLDYRNVGYGLGIPWWAYALIECRAVLHYLWLAFWPHPLVFDYGEFVPIQRIAEVIPYALILAVLGAGVLFEWRRRPAISIAGAWFFVILAPTSSVVPVVAQPIAEHRMYLPLAAVVALVVLSGFRLGRNVRSAHPTQRMIGRVATGVLVLTLAILTMKRNDDYSSIVTLWRDTTQKYPSNPRAHYNLGVALAQTGKIEDAIAQYEQAMRIKPDYAEAHGNLGATLVQAGRIPEAIEHLEQALRIKPDLVEAQNNLGIALARTGKIEEAIAHYEHALRLQPDFAEAHYNLGLALEKLGRTREAIEHYEQALKLRPDITAARDALARLQARQ